MLVHLDFLCLLGLDCQIQANLVANQFYTHEIRGFVNPLGAVNTVFPWAISGELVVKAPNVLLLPLQFVGIMLIGGPVNEEFGWRRRLTTVGRQSIECESV
jgi:membrane protease YdiL (CAAX protease family)